MNVLSKAKIKLVAEKNGWSLAQAEGYIDGETFRQRGNTPSTYAQVGIDQYCQGFRAGYYERQNIERHNPASIASLPSLPVTRLSLRRSRDSVEPADAMAVPAQGGY